MKWPILWLSALALVMPLSAAFGRPIEGVDACREIADALLRVACYDRAVDAARSVRPGETAPAPAPAPLSDPMLSVQPPAATPARPEVPRSPPPLPGSLSERWELERAHSRGIFEIRPYKPVYLMPLVASSGVNERPSSPNPETTLKDGRLGLDQVEAKFQLSMKFKLMEGLFGDRGDVWAGYTQSSRWQVYNAERSRPFHETNYEPEVMLVTRTDYSVLGWRGRMVALGVNHQSNGRSNPLSRSWNRVIGMVGVDQGDWSLMLRPWWRIKEDAADDDNADIADYIGRGELLITRVAGGHVLSLQLRHSLRGGERSRGSAELQWGFPLEGKLRGHVQLFSGYGESLIDYNFHQTRFGLGLSLVAWR